MNIDWLQVGALVMPFIAVIAAYLAGQRGRSNAIATTVDKDWINTVAEDLAEFIELQIDIVWKRWRVRVIDCTTPETSSKSYDSEGFRITQQASWDKTFRSDLLKSKLLLMLDDLDALQKKLIEAIDDYAEPVAELAKRLQTLEKNVSEKELVGICNHYDLLLRDKRPPILEAGRLVLAAKRKAIRKSI